VKRDVLDTAVFHYSRGDFGRRLARGWPKFSFTERSYPELGEGLPPRWRFALLERATR
jgi:hypothetical protein